MYMWTPVLFHFKLCVLCMNPNTHLGCLPFLLTQAKDPPTSQSSKCLSNSVVLSLGFVSNQ